jgi:hypothetical protein
MVVRSGKSELAQKTQSRKETDWACLWIVAAMENIAGQKRVGKP